MEQDTSPVQGSLCASCTNFLREATHKSELLEVGDLNAAEDEGVQDWRSFHAVEISAGRGCWLCQHALHAVQLRPQLVAETSKRICFAWFGFIPKEVTLGCAGHQSALVSVCSVKFHEVDRELGRPPGYITRFQTDRTWCPKTCQIAQRWLQQCDDTHQRCAAIRMSYSTHFRPTRLLQIRSNPVPTVKLVDPTKLSHIPSYAALSHCWGRERRGALLSSNHDEYYSGINLLTLPKTFLDAITVCQDLKIEYLWIDSLCIIQDVKEDWTKEAPRMGEVYTNAFCTIAASAADDDSEGFSRNLNPLRVSILLFTKSDLPPGKKSYGLSLVNTFQSVNLARLNTRAWVLQERALSRRILFFAEDQVYWQCPMLTDAAHGHSMGDRIEPWVDLMNWIDVSRDANRFHAGNMDEGQTIKRRDNIQQLCLHKWEYLVEDYTRRHLTYTSDTFIAISSLAQRIGRVAGWSNDDYLAGHWRYGFPWTLLWYIMPNSRTKRSADHGPSWSWAVATAPVSIDLVALGLRARPYNGQEWNLKALIEANWGPKSITQREQFGLAVFNHARVTTSGDSFGPFSDGSVTLEGFMCEVSLKTTIHENQSRTEMVTARVKEGWVVRATSPFPDCPIELDRQPALHESVQREAFFLPMIVQPEKSCHFYAGLILEPTGKIAGQYVRIGVLRPENMMANVGPQGEHSDFELITRALMESQLAEDHYCAKVGTNRYRIEII